MDLVYVIVLFFIFLSKVETLNSDSFSEKKGCQYLIDCIEINGVQICLRKYENVMERSKLLLAVNCKTLQKLSKLFNVQNNFETNIVWVKIITFC